MALRDFQPWLLGVVRLLKERRSFSDEFSMCWRKKKIFRHVNTVLHISGKSFGEETKQLLKM